MPKYEIMTILDPKSDISVIKKIADSVFGSSNIEKIEKLDKTDLAYEIKKSKTGLFILMFVNSEANLVNEFVRRSNIEKAIWRFLIINLDTEKGYNKTPKPKPEKPKFFSPHNRKDYKSGDKGTKSTFKKISSKKNEDNNANVEIAK
ncbi:30S ribosomal protein S6 [Mesomycoplasma conjunctivae]|uniref:Small ribosomal subunit protein bS6 n=1 Tax=Mesomycoplasma conjunctivae (strain ATCC 25834 / NCTC 10147 / HRC/581) TaxID=572263 RepID=C5J6P6_MESCH|nr:30S ribosomal protein S6 [Mesomycoplasma conjunctivae]CAT05156.1 30S ribosomal protein S6 [Mesomycoplasma conjunctivae]VEU66164.1 30S ribosomal protein S6 [Mesomycoplasma conjunctivae]